MSSIANNKNKIDELESIRGIAALIVVMYHIPGWNSFLHQIPLIRGGGIMVDLFFVLSGFVIYSAYGNKLNSAKEVLQFQFLRFGRLYPVHLTFLLVALGIETLKYILQAYFGIESHSKAPFVQNNLAAFLRELFLVKAFWPNETAMSFNSPAWSISAEFYTYVIFALIIHWFREFKTLVFASIAIVSIYVLYAFDPEHYNFMLRCLAGFFVGCLTAYGIQKVKKYPHDGVYKLSIWLIPLSIFWIIIIASTAQGYTGTALFIYPVSALLIAAITLSPANVFKRILSHAWLVWLGTISYSLYMAHGAVLWCYQQVIRILFHRPELMIHGISTPQFSALEAAGLITLFLLIAFIVSHITYLLIEKPFREKSRALLRSS
ncbi:MULTISPECIES: acyltransferase [unclassified Methylophilus]|uniref:acyltransferase family protein n=1 Tax=unclassified Methylophilus TaxID=2630143 RepID=UPI00035F509C|nr:MULTISPECIES: acyltransferase [unclassified Methylophilus]